MQDNYHHEFVSVVSSVLDVDIASLDGHEPLSALGLDSLGLAELQIALDLDESTVVLVTSETTVQELAQLCGYRDDATGPTD